MRVDSDILIAGGGVAGAAAALLLARQGMSVALVDRQAPDPQSVSGEIDPRVVAISPGSAAILESIGAWPGPWPERQAEYATMQVASQAGRVSFRAHEHGLAALGWIVEIPALRLSLWQQLEATPGIRLLCPEQIDDFDPRGGTLRVSLASGQTLVTRLLIAADGARSPLRTRAGIEIDEWHYNQHALIAPVGTRTPNPGVAWQRFTEDGPLALLPLPDGRSSIVWSQASALALERRDMDEAALIEQLNAVQDSPMGPIESIGKRHALPLVRRRAGRLVSGRLALLGDAARSVHPLAGQGLNLGLADAAALAELLDGPDHLDHPEPALDRYQRWRRSASEMIGGGIHAINETVRLPGGLGRHLLGGGFILAGRLWPARALFVERACGFDSDSPALARQARAG